MRIPLLRKTSTKKPKIDYQTKINKNRRLSCLLKKAIALSTDTGYEISFVVLQEDRLIEYSNQGSPLTQLKSISSDNPEIYNINNSIESYNIDSSKLIKDGNKARNVAIEHHGCGGFEDFYVYGETSTPKPRVSKKRTLSRNQPVTNKTKDKTYKKELELIKQYNRPDYEFISNENSDIPKSAIYSTLVERESRLSEYLFENLSPALSLQKKSTFLDDEYMNEFLVDIKWDNLLKNLNSYEEEEIFKKIQNPNIQNLPEIREEQSNLSRHIDNMSKFLNYIQNK